MRTDCTIDGRAVVCRNATAIGFCTVTARVGSIFNYRAPSGNTGLCRMLGRVVFAPALPGDKAHIKNWILALELAPNARHAYERWIDPAWVTEIYSDIPSAMAAFFFAPKLGYNAQTMRHLAEHGTLQNQYVAQVPERVRMFQERDKKAVQS